MKRYRWAWWVVAVVPACGADIDLGGPRATPTAGSAAVSQSGTDAGGKAAVTQTEPVETKGGAPGTSGAPPAMKAGAGGVAASAGSNGGTSPATTGGSASGDTLPTGARSGKFKLLIYSKTAAFRHDSINAGKALLNTIAAEIGIDPPEATEDNSWLSHIDDYELVFFMNTTGDVFNAQEQQVFETWMTKGGAFCGTHSATDTENGWAFYSEVTGQYYDGHGPAGQMGLLQLKPSAVDHPALADLPNPWPRNEEWYAFNSHQTWTAKPGFKVLARKDGVPEIWTREFGNFRSFYTSLGHDATAFQDASVKKHIKGGMLWTVRREHCLATPKPASCP